MKLMYAPGACSIGIHVLMEEIGKPYEAHPLAIAKGETATPEFLALNPKGKVPTLVRDDGSALTEFPAIAYYLAANAPEAKLLPADAENQSRMLETIDYVVATVHMQGFTRIFKPSAFTANEADYDSVKAAGAAIVEKSFGILDKQMAGRDYVTGSMSAADAALFYVEFWFGKRLGKQLPGNLARHFAMMQQRPAVQRVLQSEGFAT